jgi:DNA polymerase beta
MTGDYKPILIDQLSIMEKHERQAKNPFKARAYAKVLKGIKALPSPIGAPEVVLGLEGVGEKLKGKILEIFATGELHQAKEVQETSGYDIANELLKIYGVGPAKAEELVKEHRIRSLDDLRVRADELLNDKQMIGLRYLEEFNERIPRAEMKKHEKVLMKALKEVDARFEGQIVGSFRREAADSGDIDLLVKLPSTIPPAEAQEVFQRLIQYLFGGLEYITDTLALGPKKFMGVCRLKVALKGKGMGDGMASKHRRLDILLTPEEEYPYALLYFTGSDMFNVGMRRIALDRGYTMNEHGMRPVAGTGTAAAAPAAAAKKKTRGREGTEGREGVVPKMEAEEDIFRFLGVVYVVPKKRLNESALKFIPKE